MRKSIFRITGILLISALLLSGCKKNEDTANNTVDAGSNPDITAAPDVPDSTQYATDTRVDEAYAKEHGGYYLKKADGTMYILSRRIKDVTIVNDKWGVPYKSGEGQGDETGTDLYWRLDEMYNGSYVIMSCGEVPVPTVEEGENWSVVYYTSTNYDINNPPKLEIGRADFSSSATTPFFISCWRRDYAVPVYGIYGEGLHFISRDENGFPYTNTPFSMQSSDGTQNGSFTMTKAESGYEYYQYIEYDGNPFRGVIPREKYKWSWYEGSEYKEVELPANCMKYGEDKHFTVDFQLTQNGYYEYNMSGVDGLGDGVYIINDSVIWVLDTGWDPFEDMDIDNPTFYDYIWRNY